MSYADLDQQRFELMGNLYRVANLQADKALKQALEKYKPWTVVISAMAAGGAVAAGLLALCKALGI